MAFCALAMSIAWPAHVRAQCPTHAIPAGIVARVDASTLQLMRSAILQQWPQKLTLPETPTTLFECIEPFEDTVVTPKNANVALHIEDFRISVGEETLTLEGRIDVSVDGQAQLQLCALPDTTCHVQADVDNLEFRAVARVDVQDCEPQVSFDALSIDYPQEAASALVEDCGLISTTANALLTFFDTEIFSLLETELNAVAQEEAPGLISALGAELVQNDVDFGDFRFNVAPRAIDIDPQGITTTFDVNAQSLAPRALCTGLAPMPQRSVAATAPPFMGDAPLTVGASQALVQRMADLAWHNGWLCFDTRAYGLDLGAYLGDIYPGTTVHAQWQSRDPPELIFESDNTMSISTGMVQAKVQVAFPGASPAEYTLTTSARASLEPHLNIVSNMLGLSLETLIMGETQTQFPSAQSVLLSAEALQVLVQDELVPAFLGNAEALPVTSSILSLSPLALRLLTVSNTEDYTLADVGLWPIDPDDREAPQTVIAQVPPEVVGPTLELEFQSMDNATPQEFMRHWVECEGRPPQLTGAIVSLSGLEDGPAQITVHAQDLGGNRDPTPVQLSLRVDAIAPVVEIVDAPAGLTRNRYAAITFDAYDNMTASEELKLSYTATILGVTPEEDTLFARGAIKGTGLFALKNLPEDEIIVVEIFVEDTVGNQASARTTFAVNSRSDIGPWSCQQSPRVWWPLLLVGFLFWITRRQRGFAHLWGVVAVTVLSSSSAHALSNSGAFAGATRLDGTTVMWNPAALGLAPSGWLTLASGVAGYGGASYDRRGHNPQSNQEYDSTSFVLPYGMLSYTFAAPTPWQALQVYMGGYSPAAAAVAWDSDGPQRYFGAKGVQFAYALTTGVVWSPSDAFSLSLGTGAQYVRVTLDYAVDLGGFANENLPASARVFPLEDPNFQAEASLKASGWGPLATMGIFVRPHPKLRLGGHVQVPRALNVAGDFELNSSAQLSQNLPGYALVPKGNFSMRYDMPWRVYLESEYRTGPWELGLGYEFARTSVQQQLTIAIDESNPAFIEGKRHTIKGFHDDWSAGVRAAYRYSQAWKFAGRVEYDPSIIPSETLTPVNLDLDWIDATLGAQWQRSNGQAWSLSYRYVFGFQREVDNSIYNPRASQESGLGLPSANGSYQASGHMIVLGFNGAWNRALPR